MCPFNLHAFSHLQILIVHIFRSELHLRHQLLELNYFTNQSCFNGINLGVLLLLDLADLEVKELDQLLKHQLHRLLDAVVDLYLHFLVEMVDVFADAITAMDCVFIQPAGACCKQIIEHKLVLEAQ